jgi:DNA-directed RNA polymerase subunit RPC12/RpoP
MIIFFGTREVVRDDDRPGGGLQQCPRCGQYVVFKPRAARTYAHVFWIPLFPVGAKHPVVECPTCRARFSSTS